MKMLLGYILYNSNYLTLYRVKGKTTEPVKDHARGSTCSAWKTIFFCRVIKTLYHNMKMGPWPQALLKQHQERAQM